MNSHSYSVLEFDKLREEVASYAVVETTYRRVLELQPMRDYSQLQREFEIARDFMDLLKFDGGFEPSGIDDICHLSKKVQLLGSYLDAEELWKLNQNLRIFRVFKNRLEELNKYRYLGNRFQEIPVLKHIEDIINKTVDNEKNIKDEASNDLRDIRVHKKVLVSNIRQKFDDIFANPAYANAIQDRIITSRDGRSVIPVKADFKGVIKGIEHDRSSSGQTVFVEPLSIVSLNNKMRELELREKDEIRKILLRIAGTIKENHENITMLGEAVLELDFLNAKSQYALDKKSIVPNLNTREMLILEKARHPLIPADKVVPLTFEIGKGYNTLLITGPNTGGKTVALKTAGLITLMALSGIPVPVGEGSSIGMFTGIFADIGDEQSIEQNLSSFSAHLKNIQEILNGITKNSLVLLDELGSGTDPVEGSAFAMAVIDYLKEKKCKALVTTHYSEVKAHGYNDPDIETASMEFNVETLSPTYRLLVGIPGESNALTIAKRLGVSEAIIEKARSYVSDENKKVEKMIANIKEKSDELEVMKEEIALLKSTLEREKNDYSSKLAALEKEKNEILRSGYEKAEQMMKDMQAKAAGLIEKIQKEENKKEDLKEVQKSLTHLRAAITKEKSQNVAAKPKVEIKVDFKEGDKVFVKSLNQFATVLKINKNRETAIIQAGILKMELPLLDMRKSEEEKKRTYAAAGTGTGTKVKYQIDLRGKMVDEAIFELETYLDRAVMSGYNDIYVVHGKGTGALREGILKYLKGCRYVKEFRTGGHNEGGLGCTVVTLK
ncbi:MAG: endonuclease MutS2 [Fusobacteriaceae bacterium]